MLPRLISSWSRALVALTLVAAPALAGAALELPARPSGPVADLANVIEDSAESALVAELTAYFNQTGNAVVVATVPTLQGVDIETYAVELFELWQPGDAAKDTGVLLVVAPNEREVRIETGYGLEGDLPDAEAFWIIENTILPAFREGDISGGTVSGAREIVTAIGDVSYAPAQSGPALNENMIFALVAFGFVLLQVAARILASTKSWWLGGALGGGVGALAGWLLFGALFGVVGIALVLALIGLIVDFFLSKLGLSAFRGGGRGGHWGGGSSWGGGGGGSFGGFGGGSSGGGGASGRW
jgi:uncharacterized protein